MPSSPSTNTVYKRRGNPCGMARIRRLLPCTHDTVCMRAYLCVSMMYKYTLFICSLRKEISNVCNSYRVHIQVYEVQRQTDHTESDAAFVLHFKYTREASRMKMHGHGRTQFFDQVWLQHESRQFLQETVNAIFCAFDCDGFIQYNEHNKQFSFKFEAPQNLLTMAKHISLSRESHSKQEAETLLQRRHSSLQHPCHAQVVCVNSRELEETDWRFEVFLSSNSISCMYLCDESLHCLFDLLVISSILLCCQVRICVIVRMYVCVCVLVMHRVNVLSHLILIRQERTTTLTESPRLK